jgi:hypothetical protein
VAVRDAHRSPEDLLRELTEELLDAAPGAWTGLLYQATVVGDLRRDGLSVDTGRGTRRLPGVPAPVRATVERLKRAMWVPDRGTWLSVQVDVREGEGGRPPRLRVDASYDHEPGGAPIPRDAWVTELHRFPRPTDAVPDWLSRRILGDTG